MVRRKAAAFVAALVGIVCALVPGAAQAASAPSQAGSPPAFPVTVKAANGDVRIVRRPVRIVSLSPTATETLFAVGAGKQVIAVDDQSNFPAKAPHTALSGYRPNAEAIVGYRPDLVVISSNPSGIVKTLTKLGITVILAPPAVNLSRAYAQMQQLGQATGHADGAKALIRWMRKQIAQAVASVPKGGRQLSVYTELSPDFYSATSRTFIGQILGLLGLRNIADSAAPAAGDYPKLSGEFIISANPDLIVLADSKCCGQSPATVAARTGWGGIAAVRLGGVVSVSDDIASRWGPRIVAFVRIVAARVKAAKQ